MCSQEGCVCPECVSRDVPQARGPLSLGLGAAVIPTDVLNATASGTAQQSCSKLGSQGVGECCASITCVCLDVCMW